MADTTGRIPFLGVGRYCSWYSCDRFNRYFFYGSYSGLGSSL
uniref:Uncharacterized protein n=1 Tax=Brassica campestris TaxID=3711 RepID=A0A3P6DM64_BRACM|nr:unnamed protein product [Brassica rapa]